MYFQFIPHQLSLFLAKKVKRTQTGTACTERKVQFKCSGFTNYHEDFDNKVM